MSRVPSRWTVNPAAVEAARVLADTAQDVARWLNGAVSYVQGQPHGVSAWGLDGRSVFVPLGAWVIRGVDGCLTALGHDAFLARHSPVPDSVPEEGTQWDLATNEQVIAVYLLAAARGFTKLGEEAMAVLVGRGLAP